MPSISPPHFGDNSQALGSTPDPQRFETKLNDKVQALIQALNDPNKGLPGIAPSQTHPNRWSTPEKQRKFVDLTLYAYEKGAISTAQLMDLNTLICSYAALYLYPVQYTYRPSPFSLNSQFGQLIMTDERSAGSRLASIQANYNVEPIGPISQDAYFKSLPMEHNLELLTEIFGLSSLDAEAVLKQLKQEVKQGKVKPSELTLLAADLPLPMHQFSPITARQTSLSGGAFFKPWQWDAQQGKGTLYLPSMAITATVMKQWTRSTYGDEKAIRMLPSFGEGNPGVLPEHLFEVAAQNKQRPVQLWHPNLPEPGTPRDNYMNLLNWPIPDAHPAAGELGVLLHDIWHAFDSSRISPETEGWRQLLLNVLTAIERSTDLHSPKREASKLKAGIVDGDALRILDLHSRDAKKRVEHLTRQLDRWYDIETEDRNTLRPYNWAALGSQIRQQVMADADGFARLFGLSPATFFQHSRSFQLDKSFELIGHLLTKADSTARKGWVEVVKGATAIGQAISDIELWQRNAQLIEEFEPEEVNLILEEHEAALWVLDSGLQHVVVRFQKQGPTGILITVGYALMDVVDQAGVKFGGITQFPIDPQQIRAGETSNKTIVRPLAMELVKHAAREEYCSLSIEDLSYNKRMFKRIGFQPDEESQSGYMPPERLAEYRELM